MVYLTFTDSASWLTHGRAGHVLHFQAAKPLTLDLNPDGSLTVQGTESLFPYNKG